MAIKKRGRGQALSGADLKKFRHAVSELKAKGLTSKRVDARSQKPTRYMRGQVKKYNDVLTGKAKVIHVDKRSSAKEFENSGMRTKGKSVVVPIINKDERVYYNKKSGEIFSKANENGRRIRKVIKNKNIDLYDMKTYPRGPGILYRMPGPGGSFLFQTDSLEEFFAEMFKYETKPHNPYKNIYSFAQIIYPDGSGDEGEGDME